MLEKSSKFIKTPRQLITVVVLAFVVPVILIILLATYVVRSTPGGAAGSDAMSEKAIAERMQPVGFVAVADSGAAKSLQTGEAVYAAACSACHATGVAGAPKTGDKAAWTPRVAQGANVLHDHALKGYQGKAGVMPAKGGNAALSDEDVKAAVDYMVGVAK